MVMLRPNTRPVPFGIPQQVRQWVTKLEPLTYHFEVDLNNDGLYGGLYEDFTTDLIGPVTIIRGRQQPNALTSYAEVGKLTAVVRNDSGKYSPSNASSPLYPNLVQRRPCRFRYTDAQYTNRFTGYIKSIVPTRQGNIPIAIIQAEDGLALFANKKISPAPLANALTGTIVGAILDAAGWSSTMRRLDTGQTTVARWFVQDEDVLKALRDIEDTELGMVYVDGDGYIVFEDRHHRSTGAYLTSQATYSDAPGAAFPYLNPIETPDRTAYIVNQATAQVTPYTVNSIAVLWTLTGETPTIGPGASLTRYALWPTHGGGNFASGAYVETWTTPDNTDVTVTGVAFSDLAITVVVGANQLAITIKNNHVSNTATITQWRARGTAVIKGTATGIQSDDATSQGKYGVRTYRNPGPWIPDTNTAQSYCDGVVQNNKDDAPTVVLKFLANLTPALMLELLHRKISDRVSVVGQQTQTALGLSADFFVERIEDRIDIQNHRIEETMYLSPAAVSANYWILGTSVLDTTTVLGF